jgi:nucleotide-binding universal stress UspA family protein
MAATDGSSGADRAVDVAAALAMAVGSDLSIVTVAGNLSGEEMRLLTRSEGNIGDVLESLSAQVLAAASERARHLGVAKIKVQTA